MTTKKIELGRAVAYALPGHMEEPPLHMRELVKFIKISKHFHIESHDHKNIENQ